METIRLDEMLTNAEAAARLGIGPNTLEGWRTRKQGPNFYRVGRRVYYAPADVDEYIARTSRFVETLDRNVVSAVRVKTD